jgi:dihydroflavonol-4-reductase
LILVSGATGFLGAHMVCRLLQQGLTVRAMKRSTSSLDEFNLIYATYFENSSDTSDKPEWIDADVLDIPSLNEAFSGVTEVYHCAAVVSFHPSDKEMMHRINVEGTANMVNTALEHSVSKFCHVSSIAAIGRSGKNSAITEQTAWVTSKHNSNYAISKYKAELEVWRAAEEGLPVTIVNPGVIIGVGKWNRGTCALFKMVWDGLPFYTLGVNGYVDVKDVTQAMFLLMENKCFNERFILVGQNIENRQFMFSVSELLKKRKPYIRINKQLAELAWRLYAIWGFITQKQPKITRETARASQNTYWYSSEKITKQLAFNFTPINETFTYICHHFLKQHHYD